MSFALGLDLGQNNGTSNETLARDYGDGGGGGGRAPLTTRASSSIISDGE
jgi:hypothetical protein